MNHQLLKPVCMVVGRNLTSFHYLQRQLGSRATFVESTEAKCLTDHVQAGADIVVILWSSTSRQCAQLIHRNHPQAKVILEGNRTSLPGLPEKNGFLSVIEKSQCRSELVRQVEAAIEDCEAGEEAPPLRESAGIDSSSLVGRLPSIPVVSGDIQRTAENLLDLLLGAIKSGSGGLFLRDDETNDYLSLATRNLPYQAHALRIGRSSKLVSLLSGQSAPIQFAGNAPGSALSTFVGSLGCNTILPLLLEGTLHGWFVFLISEQLGPVEKNILTSMGFFAVETLKQSYATLQARQKNELNTAFLTQVTDALAWIKPDGELNIVHDANHLIAVRGPEETGSFTRLASSALKGLIHEARQGKAGKMRVRNKGTGRFLYGKATCLADGSTLVNLSTEGPEDSSWSGETDRSESSWRDLALSTLAEQRTAFGLRGDASLLQEVADRIRDLLLEEGEGSQVIASILDSASCLFPRIEILDPAHASGERTLSSVLAANILLLALGLRLWQDDAKGLLRISLNTQCEAVVHIQLDFGHGGRSMGARPAAARTLEYIATEGARSSGGPVAFSNSAFGCRWELSLSTAAVPAPTPLQVPTLFEMPKPAVLHKGLNVLQNEANTVNHGVNELHG